MTANHGSSLRALVHWLLLRTRPHFDEKGLYLLMMVIIWQCASLFAVILSFDILCMLKHL